jgi:hypothetical protein
MNIKNCTVMVNFLIYHTQKCRVTYRRQKTLTSRGSTYAVYYNCNNGTQVKNSNILTKAPKKQKHQKQSQTLKGRNPECHGIAASFHKKKKN